MEKISNHKNELIDQLIQLRDEIEDSLFDLSNSHQIDMTDASKQNLCAFLALQRFLNPALDSFLVQEGFSSIQMMSPHVLYSLNKIISHLSPNQRQNDHYIDIEHAVYLKNQRNQELLGKSEEDPISIMVTLDKTMLDTPEIFKDLLRAGMTIARINLARDHSVWKKLVEGIRAAEEELGFETQDRTCKIYMDLPGPKIRVGDLRKIKVPLKINTKKTSAVGYLMSQKSHENPIKDGFVIKINIDEFTNAAAGQIIHFTDAKGRKRFFTILEIVSPACLKVELNKSAILNGETIVELSPDKKSKLTNLLEGPVTIKVKMGDILRIYKSYHYLGKPTMNGEPASIGITLPEALRNVRPKDRVFFDDGNICGVVLEVNDHYLDVEIILTRNNVETIKPDRGVNFPDSLVFLSVPAITKMDITMLAEIIPFVDLIGISFIHHPNDIRILKGYLDQYTERKIGVIAKIETKYALLSLTKIVLEGVNLDLFGVMIARGDLAIEIGYEQLAKAQEGILEICRAAHAPVIWATSILNQMNKTGIPLRAELTDAYTGLRSDCIMINKGPYISNSVKFLQQLDQIKKDPLLEFRNSLLSFVQYDFQ
ncbi:pyruvate kinase [Niallia oryzisoli]|uniref:Pyruvate kinase n=1 Tax=Niallia oryzisoli TaxID=1737571 RepID=A0ABZ2CDH6_9BACI